MQAHRAEDSVAFPLQYGKTTDLARLFLLTLFYRGLTAPPSLSLKDDLHLNYNVSHNQVKCTQEVAVRNTRGCMGCSLPLSSLNQALPQGQLLSCSGVQISAVQGGALREPISIYSIDDPRCKGKSHRIE